MKTAAFPTLLHRLEQAAPSPARSLRLARLFIPLCLFTGLVAEPLLRWLLPI